KCRVCRTSNEDNSILYCKNLPPKIYRKFKDIEKRHQTESVSYRADSIYEAVCTSIEIAHDVLFTDKYILRSEVDKDYILKSDTEQSTAPDPTQPLPIDEFAQFAAQSKSEPQSKPAEVSTPSKPVPTQEEPPFTDKEKEHHALLIKFGGCTP